MEDSKGHATGQENTKCYKFNDMDIKLRIPIKAIWKIVNNFDGCVRSFIVTR